MKLNTLTPCLLLLKDQINVKKIDVKEINVKKNGRSITCISLTSSLYWDSTKLTCPLKAQQTPVSVITGVKISEQFTLKKALIEF